MVLFSASVRFGFPYNSISSLSGRRFLKELNKNQALDSVFVTSKEVVFSVFRFNLTDTSWARTQKVVK